MAAAIDFLEGDLDVTDAKKFGENVQTRFARLQAYLLEKEKKGGTEPEEFARIVADIKKVTGDPDGKSDEEKKGLIGLHRDEVMELKRKLELAEGEKAQGETLKPGSLRHISLSRRFEGQEMGDPGLGNTLAKLNDQHGQLDLLCKTADELGIFDEKERRVLLRWRQLHNSVIGRAMSLTSEPRVHLMDPKFVQSLPEGKEYMALSRTMRLAAGDPLADATAGSGAEWVPTLVVAGPIVPIKELGIPFHMMLDSWTMRHLSDRRRVKTTHGAFYGLVENVATAGNTTNAKAVPYGFGTDKATFTAFKLASAMIETPEWDQDLIDINGGQEIQADITYNLEDGVEDIAINGQVALLDNGYPSTPSGTVSDQALANGIRKMFAQTGQTAQDFGAGIVGSGLAAIMGGMGAFGMPEECVWLTGAAGFARMLTAKADDGSPLYLTYMQMGRDGASVTGALGTVFGSPLVVSKRVPETLSSAGVIPASPGTKTALYRVNVTRVSIGSRLGTVVTRSTDYRFLENQVVYLGIRRLDIEPLVAANTVTSAYKLVGAAFNIPTF